MLQFTYQIIIVCLRILTIPIQFQNLFKSHLIKVYLTFNDYFLVGTIKKKAKRKHLKRLKTIKGFNTKYKY